MTTWQQVRPRGYWMVVKADPTQTETSGGIVLTQDLPGAAKMGYTTGQILSIGTKVLEFLNMNRDEKLTENDLLTKKLVYKHYLSEVIRFLTKDEDNQEIFMIHIADPNLNIIGICDPEDKIDLI